MALKLKRNLKRKSVVLFLFFVLSAVLIAPVAKADNVNLAPYPDSFLSWGGTGHITYPFISGGRECTRVEFNPAYCDISRGGFEGGAMSELNSPWYPISVGDRIVLSAWLRADPSTCGGTFYGIGGIRIGMDMYANGRICEIDSLDGLDGWTGAWNNPVIEGYYEPSVVWGSGWTHVVYDFIVPSVYLTDPNCGFAYTVNQNVEPSGFICWISTDGDTLERANGYFYDTELYINPSGSPSGNPTPTPTATPTQSGGGGGGGWIINPTSTPKTNISDVKDSITIMASSILNGISDTGRVFLLLAVGVVAFLFVGKKH
jgi:hypothetical protein